MEKRDKPHLPFFGGRKEDNTEKVEFGETYHLALALQLCPDATAYINDFQPAVDFLTQVNLDGQLCSEKPENGQTRPLPETKTIITESSDLVDGRQSTDSKLNTARRAIWNTVRKLEKAGWTKDAKDLFKRLPSSACRKALIWVRAIEENAAWRNMTAQGLQDLVMACEKEEIEPIIIGDIPVGSDVDLSATPCIGNFWEDAFFRDSFCYAKQLWFINKLYEDYNLIVTIGMMSGTLDGIAFFPAQPVIFFEGKSSNIRMSAISEALNPDLIRIELEKKLTDQTPFDLFAVEDLKILHSRLIEIKKNARSGKS